ncbi:MAG: hypothetical protein WDZ62_02590 [Candidatus Pacearchaeota archaeon]
MIKNKKGWIKIVESFLAILLVAGIVIVVVGGENTEEDFSEIKIMQSSILMEIRMDNSIRGEIIETGGEVSWEDVQFPNSIKNKVIDATPISFECEGKICDPGEDCSIEEKDSNIFSKSSIIFADIDNYNPRVLKLYCWD